MKCYMKSRLKHHIPLFLYAYSPMSIEQKCTTWKLRVMVYSRDKTEDLSLEYSLWNTALKRYGRSWDTWEFLQQRPGSQNIKRLLLNRENHLSQLNEFSTFLRVRRCKSLGSLKSLLWYAPSYLGPLSWALSSWVPSGCITEGSYRGRERGRGQPTHLHSGSLQARLRGGCSDLMAANPLFADMTGNIFHSHWESLQI